ncbi:MAG: glutamine--fructose-6-phosphate transaminase (isomerizing) [Pseudomonadota bacterium]
MCGIIGYVGDRQAKDVLLDGLKRLEYRGYDSAGIAIYNSEVVIKRAEGKLAKLEAIVNEAPPQGHLGIGHTRWATHGRPSETNAHPHRAGNIILVHNGIVENHVELKDFLEKNGHEFTSETDTEVACHLISHFAVESNNTFEAIQKALQKIRGSYALVIMDVKDKTRLYMAKKASPLVIGLGQGENFVASDIPALLPYTKHMIFLDDGEIGILTKDSVQIFSDKGEPVAKEPQNIPWNPLMAERGGYKHFMLKEIFEQPTAVENTLAGRISHATDAILLDEIKTIFPNNTFPYNEITIIACGTSWHAGLVGKYYIEKFARIRVNVDLASEYRYRNPIVDEKTLVIPISQSGETADTLAAVKMVQEKGAKVLSICNVVGSSISRIAEANLYTHAGPEIGVASTKAFTAQLAVLLLFALYLGHYLKNIDNQTYHKYVEEMFTIPRKLKKILDSADQIKAIAEEIVSAPNVIFIARGASYPIALEGALKLKEISYMHAEGFPAGELKHGPIALVDNDIPVIATIPQDDTYEKTLSNIEEVRARGAKVISITTNGQSDLKNISAHVISIPKASWFITPLLATIPLQLIAYYVADHKGTDVDQPRNLAKSVTVE